jgi:hypothetical protein
MKTEWARPAPKRVTQDVLHLIKKAVASELTREQTLQNEVKRLKLEITKLRQKVSEQSVRADHWRYMAKKAEANK